MLYEVITIIEDTFGPSNGVHLKLVNDKVNVYKVDIDDNGNATRDALINESEYDLKILKDASGFETGFTLEFNNEITEAYVIEYQTEITERIYSGQYVNNSVTFGTIVITSYSIHYTKLYEISLYQRIVDKLPHMEDGYFGLMQIYSTLNHQVEVRKMFQILTDKLREEFDVAPSKELIDWYSKYSRSI